MVALAARVRAHAPVEDRTSALRGLRAAREVQAVSSFLGLGYHLVHALQDAAQGAWVSAADNAAQVASESMCNDDEPQHTTRAMTVDLVERMIAITA